MRLQIALVAALLVLAPISATAETAEEQQACMDDAFNYCGEFIPDRDRVAACLAQNLNRISRLCRTVMLRYSRPTTPVRSSSSVIY
jgi:hypothetical protein